MGAGDQRRRGGSRGCVGRRAHRRSRLVRLARGLPADLPARAPAPARNSRSSTSTATGTRASSPTKKGKHLAENAANSSVGRPAGAIAPSLSHTSFSGRAPILDRQWSTPHRMSGASLEKISAPAISRDQHSSAATTQPRLVCPWPTGTGSRGSHKSHCTNSPGRYTVRWNVRLTRNRGRARAHSSKIVLPPA